MEQEKLEKLTDVLLDGLCYDGGHHKQYYIYQALLILHGSKENIYKILASEVHLDVEDFIEIYGEIDEGVAA